MRVTVNIELTDRTSEEELSANGLSPKFLLNLYTDAFKRILNEITEGVEGVKTEILVCVTDNTKEEK